MGVPVPGHEVTYAYGEKSSRYKAGYHTGEDYRCDKGTKVVATTAGHVVALNTWGSDYGNHVVVQSDRTTGKVRHGYCHLSRIDVAVGDHVDEGQQIGLSGKTGNVTGPHLHYEERTEPYTYHKEDRKPQFSHDGRGLDDSPWAGGDVLVNDLRFGREDSDSVRRLQFRLKHHDVTAHWARDLPVTGNWLDLTTAVVREWQRRVPEKGPDDGMSMPGFQAQRLFGKRYKIKPTPQKTTKKSSSKAAAGKKSASATAKKATSAKTAAAKAAPG
jgi:murein DD-endopeptidase MepM/ murein hydrolase activator NlpD